MTLEFEHIRNACIYISYANGGVNRDRSIVTVLGNISSFLDEHRGVFDLPKIDQFLSTLSADDIETLCDGDQDEAEKICESGPNGVHELLNAYFDVC